MLSHPLPFPHSSPKNIAINTLFLIPHQVGGSETALRSTLEAMINETPEHSYFILTNRENHDSFQSDLAHFPNVRLIATNIPASSRFKRLLGEWFTIPHLAHRLHADVLWCPGNFAPFYAPCRVVTTIHDMQYRHFPEDYSRLELLYMHFFTTISILSSTRILTVSRFSQSEIVRFFPRVKGRVVVALHGVNDTFSKTSSPPVPSSTPSLLCIANTYPHKHVEDAVRIFARLAPEFPALRLNLVGQPRRGEPLLQQTILSLSPDIQARIHRIHRVPLSELTQTLQTASVFLFPSLYEGFGLPILEALKAEVPVVAPRAASIPEVGGPHIHLYEPGDLDSATSLVRTLLHTPPTAQQLSAGRAWADAFTWHASAKETLNALVPKESAK